RAADGERPDRVRELGDRAARQLDDLARQTALVEEDDGGRRFFQPDDLVGAKVGHKTCNRGATELQPGCWCSSFTCPRPKKPGTSPAPRSAGRSRRPSSRA